MVCLHYFCVTGGQKQSENTFLFLSLGRQYTKTSDTIQNLYSLLISYLLLIRASCLLEKPPRWKNLTFITYWKWLILNVISPDREISNTNVLHRFTRTHDFLTSSENRNDTEAPRMKANFLYMFKGTSFMLFFVSESVI